MSRYTNWHTALGTASLTKCMCCVWSFQAAVQYNAAIKYENYTQTGGITICGDCVSACMAAHLPSLAWQGVFGTHNVLVVGCLVGFLVGPHWRHADRRSAIYTRSFAACTCCLEGAAWCNTRECFPLA